MPNAALPADDLLQPGFMAIHGNRLEDLRDLTAQWLVHAPLTPLENEVVLVQSNGIAQWFKQALARPFGAGGLGISAAVDVQLPGRFLWSAYRAVLGRAAPATASPFDPERLVWRLLRLLPTLVALPDFEPLRRYLGDDDDGRKRHQLAERLADLYDQYQVHRADWLDDWEHARNVVADPLRNTRAALPDSQHWQAELWRRLLDDVGTPHRDNHRGAVHRRFLTRYQQSQERPPGLPRRIVVFGISSLPLQTLEALAALGKFCQVLLVVMNPCRQYWADIVEDRDLLRAEQRRHGAGLLTTQLPQSGTHPLLAAWGKQGRDYIRLLDLFDAPDGYRQRFAPLGRSIDLYTDTPNRNLLQQIQQNILDLHGVPAREARQQLAVDDCSLRFHSAHSAQREVEILHDQLLALRDQASRDGTPLLPRDVIVMVPDIQTYAPHIDAVFGRHGRDDPRHLPYSIADRRSRGNAPLLIALETLLGLPDSRCTVSDVLGLLDAPALRRRFSLDEAAIATLRRWIAESGIRWGLHAQQRAALDLPENLDQNTWLFGLRRMLLGHAVGSGEPWHGIEPYDEIGGLGAAHVGALAALLERLDHWWQRLAQPARPQDWDVLLRELLVDFFDGGNDADDVVRLDRLRNALDDWSQACADARLVEPIERAIVVETWLAAIDEQRLSQRFGGGAVNFATLMPMRAIPFRVVCLLGMNDGDYPRSRPPLEFDLMARAGSQRPGDRSRREDDRYLFLEALLSVREHLHVSWIGRSARDNDARPPSVLVGQLRDSIAAGWRLAGHDDDDGAALAAITVQHPLQAFSRRYFDGSDARQFSYAAEWRAALRERAETAAPVGPIALPLQPAEAPINLAALQTFLRHPVHQFFNERLKVYFDAAEEVASDLEPFAIDALDRSRFGSELLAAAIAAVKKGDGDGETAIAHAMARLRRSGALPLPLAARADFEALGETVGGVLARYRDQCRLWPHRLPRRELRIEHAGVVLEDWLVDVLQGDESGCVRLLAIADALFDKSGDHLKWHRLLGAWVQHLGANASGLSVQTRIVAADALIVLRAPDPGVALSALRSLIEARQRGMQSPLALACKTGFAWLEAARAAEANPERRIDPLAAARACFDGDHVRAGEVREDAYLARVWPDFDQLERAGFDDELLIYASLVEHLHVDGAAP